jgi:hypothetical protein
MVKLIDAKQIAIARKTSSISQSITANATFSGTITLPKSCSIISITCSTQCWVRLYNNTASQSADSTRAITTTPTSGSGVILEVNTATLSFNPVPFAINAQSSISTSYPITITNNGATGTITVTITYIDSLEN